MKLRRLFAIILAIAMLLTMAACSKDPEKTPAANSGEKNAANTENNSGKEDDAQQVDIDAEADADDAAAQQEQVPASREDEDKNDKVGYISGVTYRNPYFNLTFNAPENGTYYDDQTLLAMSGAYNLPEDVDDAFAAQMEQAGAYVMMITDLNGVGVNIIVKKTPDAYKGLSDEQLYSLVKPDQEAQLQHSGLTGTVEVGTATFLNETRAALNTIMQDAGMMQKQIYLVQDDYTCIITASANDAETLDDIMAHFVP